jgi:geranylgeranyl diphosphate synthase, type II
VAVSGGYPEHLREEVEAYLRALRFSEEPLTAGLEEAMRYSLLAGGKRIRPVLALATARAVGIEHGEVLPLAGAIELIHTYSLIHDDLPAMDDDDLRRGQPTCHVKFGEDVAILAGDGLYAEAFHHLLTCQRAAPDRVLAAAAQLAAATGVNGMVGGQYADVMADRGHAAGAAGSAAGSLRRLHELKTGRLIGASVLCVLLLTGIADGPETAPYRRFAAELGVLFQIVDDILDVTGTDDALGKPRGSDERHGKRTYVSEFGVERARELAGESHRLAREALAQVAAGRPGSSAGAAQAEQGGERATAELEGIADFIFTRTS